MCPMPCLVLFTFVKCYAKQFVIAAYRFFVVVFSLIKINNESIFCFSLKYISIMYYSRYKQNRQLSFLVKSDTKIAILKVKAHEKSNSCSQFFIKNNTDEKERVECWTLSLPYNYKLW